MTISRETAIAAIAAGLGIGAALLSGVELHSTAKKLDISIDELKKGAKERITDAAIDAAVHRAADDRVLKMTSSLTSSAAQQVTTQVREAVSKVIRDNKEALIVRATANVNSEDLEIDKVALKRDIYQRTLEKCASELFDSIKSGMNVNLGTPSSSQSSVVKDILSSDLSDWRKQELIGKVVENQ